MKTTNLIAARWTASKLAQQIRETLTDTRNHGSYAQSDIAVELIASAVELEQRLARFLSDCTPKEKSA